MGSPTLSEQVKSLRSRLKKCRDENKYYETINKTLKQELAELRSGNLDAEKIEELRSEKQLILQNVEALEVELKDLNKRLKSANESKAELKKEIDLLKSEKESIQEEQKEKESQRRWIVSSNRHKGMVHGTIFTDDRDLDILYPNKVKELL